LIWLWVIGVFVLIVLLILGLSYVHSEIHFVREENQDHCNLKIKASIGIKVFRYMLPIIQLKSITQKIPLSVTTKQSSNFKQTGAPLKNKTNKTKDKGKYKGIYHKIRLLLQNTDHLYEWMKNTLCRIECTKLQWVSRIGIGDAPQTAIAAGAVWGLKSSLLGFIMHWVQVRAKPIIEVIPQYNGQRLSTEFTGAAGFRVISMVWAGLELVWRIMKIKGGLRTWFRVMRKPNVMT
jgi:hypothetical protein